MRLRLTYLAGGQLDLNLGNRMSKYVVLILICLFYPLVIKSEIYAAAAERYITIVNPVRDSSLWQNSDSVLAQIELLREHKLPATWLLQYSAFTDPYVIEIFNQLPVNHELGILLEVDEKLANEALVPYLFGDGDWARADKVLLSGYSPSERKRMITLLFNKFKKTYGYFPTAVGAWYVDTVSLNFMVDRYHIKTILDVSDQFQTDTYGAWGKPWGVPYYPSRLNSLIPAQTYQNKLTVVKIQWAQRDPVRGYGLTVFDSTFSLQANDYNAHNLKTDYFRHLSQSYLNSYNNLSQLTIGLEAGQEGASFYQEYERQILSLLDWRDKDKLSFTTMSEFATKYMAIYPGYTANFIVQGVDYENPSTSAVWFSTPFYRVGFVSEKNILKIRDLRIYEEKFLFNDIYDRDKNKQLKRIVPAAIDELINQNSLVLISDIKNINIIREDEDFIILVVDNLDKLYEIKLDADTIFFNKKPILEIDGRNNIFNKFSSIIASLLIKYQVGMEYNWKPSIRFSSINKSDYFGLWASPDKLFGISTIKPYVGVFEFPFQILSRFKTIPDVNVMRIISKYFINSYKPSTINIKI